MGYNWVTMGNNFKKVSKINTFSGYNLFSLLQKKGHDIFLKKIFIPLFLDYREYYENKKTKTF
jgi:hypothetical protein